MRNYYWLIIALLLVILLNACGMVSENSETVDIDVSELASEAGESAIEITEPVLGTEPEWFSEAAIDEAYACLFPIEGEKNVELAREILLPLVEAGNAEAQYYWGYIYDWEIVDNNGDEEKESLYWHTLALEQGFVKSYLAAALNEYIESEERANELVELAKQAGLFEMTSEKLGADGCQMIGSYYYSMQDYNSAFEWYTKAADMGCSVAPMIIGHLYYNGQGVEQDISAAMDWYLNAANRGNAYAMNYYGYYYFKNNYANEIIDKKYATADEYREAAKAGDPIAMHNLGQMYAHGLDGLSSNQETAFNWYLKAAEVGDSRSMYQIGYMYHYGLGVEENFDSAAAWYLKAADLGNADAMNALGLMYSQGEGLERDDKQARLWWAKASNAEKNPENDDNRYINYFSEVTMGNKIALEQLQKAADLGSAAAMINIANYGYETGYLVFDQKQATDWYKEAVDEGEPTAMAYLGYNYYEKYDDYDAAMEWLIKAYANGEDYVAADIDYMLTKKQGVNAYFEHYGELISTN